MTISPRYRRVMLKVSGEALMGERGFGIDSAVINRIAGEIAEAGRLGVQVGVVIGGGNIFRGVEIAGHALGRVTGDHMGMLATVMNGLALVAAVEHAGVPARIMSNVAMPTICETYAHPKAMHHFEEGRVVIFAGGTGSPFFTTDTAAALKAAEMECDALMKATKVDGIYSADPRKHPDAVRYDTLTYQEVLAKGLEVMDAAAIALARDNRIPIIVFSIHEPGAFLEVLKGKGRATVVAD